MRNLALISLALFLSSCTLLAQGTIRFNTRIDGLVDAPISWDRDGLGAFPGAMAQLYLVPPTGAPVALVPATTFQTSSTTAMFYVNEPMQAVTVPGALAGSTVNIMLRVWIGGSSFETATTAVGESEIIPISLGGVLPDGSTLPPAVLVGLQGFAIRLGIKSRFDSIILSDNNNVSIDATYQHFFLTGSGWILESSTDFQSWQAISTNGTGFPSAK